MGRLGLDPDKRDFDPPPGSCCRQYLGSHLETNNELEDLMQSFYMLTRTQCERAATDLRTCKPERAMSISVRQILVNSTSDQRE